MSGAIARPARLADAPAVLAIGRVAFSCTYEGVLAPAFINAVVDPFYDDEAVAASIAAAEQDPNSRFLVAEVHSVQSRPIYLPREKSAMRAKREGNS